MLHFSEMGTDEISLRDYIDKQLACHSEIHRAQALAVEVAAGEMRDWKHDHNNLQKQMKEFQSTFSATFLSKADYIREHSSLSSKIDQTNTSLSSKIDQTNKLVYIGVGLAIALNFGFAAFQLFLKR
jgi:hypothetical protein